MKYVSFEDATLVNGTDIKPDINDDPTLQIFMWELTMKDIEIHHIQKHS